MKILSPEQIRQWDRYSIEKQQISSLDLMERAANACFKWLEKKGFFSQAFFIFCGKGNNGGDGLALARMLAAREVSVRVFILEFGHLGSEDFQANLNRLHDTDVPILFLQREDQFPSIEGEVIIDAMFGYGLNRPPEGLTSSLIRHICQKPNTIVSIDVPSGLFIHSSSRNNEVVAATFTLSFQVTKLAFLMPENEKYLGEVVVLDIGLEKDFPESQQAPFETITQDFIKTIYKPRNSFAHKGVYGHALIATGSYGKIGAAILSCGACLRSGVGLLTACIPYCGYAIMQTAVPEAMVIPDSYEKLLGGSLPDLAPYNAIGIGPGLGTDGKTVGFVERLLSSYENPLVVDADALNILASNIHFMEKLPPLSILTPHPKEFERLFGKTSDDWERVSLARNKAKEFEVIIVLKGHHTFIAMPGGKGYFNTTGNPGMATGGSGDVLTGILTALLAQGYQPALAAILGCYLHGLAGDMAAQNLSEEAMIASDITAFLADAFTEIRGFSTF